MPFCHKNGCSPVSYNIVKNRCSPVAYNLVIKWMQSCLIQSCHKMNAVMSHIILSSKWMQSCLMLVYATTSVLFYRLSLCNKTLGKKKKKYCKGNVCSKIYGIVFSKVWSIQNHTRTLPKSHSDFTKIILRLYQNHTPTLPKSHSDFYITTGWLSQHHKLIFTKSHSDFTKITLRLYQNRRLIFTKRGLILKPQIVVLLYAFSKPHPPPFCVLLVRRLQQFRHVPVG